MPDPAQVHGDPWASCVGYLGNNGDKGQERGNYNSGFRLWVLGWSRD